MRAFLSLTLLLLPYIALAQGTGRTFSEFVTGTIVPFANQVVVPIIGALAFLAFIWGIFRYFFRDAADATSRAEGRLFALWGIIGLVVIFSLWGLVNIFLNTFWIGR